MLIQFAQVNKCFISSHFKKNLKVLNIQSASEYASENCKFRKLVVSHSMVFSPKGACCNLSMCYTSGESKNKSGSYNAPPQKLIAMGLMLC
jgi:hypothetical protein